MPHYLLTGAGFSRNWGGFLADEAFEYLLTRPLDDSIRRLLWDSKNKGGFETALAQLQVVFKQSSSPQNGARLQALTSAVMDMFRSMNAGLARATFDSTTANPSDITPVAEFLRKFDAIFTLNQDTLLEHHYVDNPKLGRFGKTYLPYVKREQDPGELTRFASDATMVPDLDLPLQFKQQPYYKLHGSSNWVSGKERLLVVGGNKPELLKQFPILERYRSEFAAHLSKPNARLMIIGYSFGDEHINEIIAEACSKGLKLFIIDPNGTNSIDTRRAADKQAAIAVPLTEFTQAVMPSIIGASRRDLRNTIFHDSVERAKVWSFFD
jgi:hypothetical protein